MSGLALQLLDRRGAVAKPGHESLVAANLLLALHDAIALLRPDVLCQQQLEVPGLERSALTHGVLDEGPRRVDHHDALELPP